MTTANTVPIVDGSTRRRLALIAMLVAAVTWAFWWGAHEHAAPLQAADLVGIEPDQRYVVDASLGSLDLSDVEVRPGAVVEFLLTGSAGAPHSFVLAGAAPGAEIHQSTDPTGDTVVRMRVPEDGGLSFICAIPGHEGLHGSLVVRTGTSP